jgi:hypothetical protein
MSPIPARAFARLSEVLTAAIAIATLTFVGLAVPAPSLSAATPPPLTVGQVVCTTNKTNVRSTADGTLIGTQPRFAIGAITAGPVFVSGDSVFWVKVVFNSGPSGWVGADMLINGIPTPKNVNVGSGFGQSVILDEIGNIEVGFTSKGGPNVVNPTYSFSESTNQGLSFSTPTVLPALHFTSFSVVPPSTNPQIAAERGGAIDIVYECPETACPQGNRVPDIELIRSIDHGVTWSAPVQINMPPSFDSQGPTGGAASSPVIAACGSGVTVAWIDAGVGTKFVGPYSPDLFTVQVLNGVPGAPINVSFGNLGDKTFPQILINPQGTVYLSWSGENADQTAENVFFASIPNCAAVAQ